ncbi:hypothetical protein [Timonella senegalensis]|uniref:hypothetical protein n=1 Tax=Timonella senegalensis TaxID=1465825 RepID=UPI0018A85C32|nr:hypothetical protein [Timonella senegalensis]
MAAFRWWRAFGALLASAFHSHDWGRDQILTRLEELKRAKELAWESIKEAPADKRGPLFSQWRALSAEIAQLEAEEEPAEKGTVLDELKKRRELRGARTAG